MESESAALSAARQILERYAGRTIAQQQPGPRPGADAIFWLNDEQFVVEVKSSARSDSVARAISQLRHAVKDYPHGQPLLVVPSMGETGIAICEQESINWIDLSGNGSVNTDRVHIYVRGRRDRWADFASEAGINPFSKTASRVAHALLTDTRRKWRRSELESSTGLDKGYISKIVTALSKKGYVEEISLKRSRALCVVDPVMLLDGWRERYNMKRPRFWGLLATHSGLETIKRSAKSLESAAVDYAISGLGAAAHYTGFGSFRRVDVYVSGAPPEAVASELNIGTNERGRNIAFHDDLANASIGLNRGDGIRFVSPILTYLDLSNLSERSEEAADEMRRYLVTQWK